MCDPIHAVYQKHGCKHLIRVMPKVLGDWMIHFPPRVSEITMACTQDELRLRSFSDGYEVESGK
jgi:hypothetical protein